MSEPELVWVRCDRCHGSGGPPPVWDEELGRWQHYVCGSCSGRGEQRVWSDGDPT